MDFTGTYDHTLDAKNRMTVPARYRGEFGSVVILAKSVDECVAMWRIDDYPDYVDSVLATLNPASPEARRMQRFFRGSAFETPVDAAGRVMIPPRLIDYAGLRKEVVVAAGGRYMEIWDRERWNELDGDLPDEVRDLTAKLSHQAA